MSPNNGFGPHDPDPAEPQDTESSTPDPHARTPFTVCVTQPISRLRRHETADSAWPGEPDAP
jgi:hypothetical protein